MRRYTIVMVGLVLLSLTGSLAAEESFWCGGDITKSLPPEVVESLQAALEDAYNAVLGSFFTVAGDGSGDPPPTGVLTHKPEKTWPGYTLLSSLGGHLDPDTGVTHGAILVDMDGTIVKEWPLVPYPARILPGGYVMGGEGQFEEFTGVPSLVQLDWDGNKVWEWNGFGSSFPDASYHSGFHHDYQREGNPVGYYAPGVEAMAKGGKTLILSHYIPPLDWTAHITVHPLFDDALYEVDWEGNLTWEWHLWEHFDELGFSEAAKEAIYDNYVGRVPDVGSDYMHTNEVSFLGPNKWYDAGDQRFHPDNMMIDCRSSNITMIVARHDHPEGDWQEGDIIWRIGPDYSYGHPEYKLGQIIGQHQAHIIQKGLPGAGNVLLFDNGGMAGYGPLMKGMKPMVSNKLRDYSRVLEFNPVTLEVVWEYACPEPKLNAEGQVIEPVCFSAFVSGAQRLVNGNTLVCEGQSGRVFELTPEKEIVWDYVADFERGDTGMGFLGPNTFYRAERVPYTWIPQVLENGTPVTGLSGAAGSKRYFRINVPAGADQLIVRIFGEAELYVKHDALPTTTDYDYVLATANTDEVVGFTPKAGTWYLMVTGGDYSDVTIEATWY